MSVLYIHLIRLAVLHPQISGGAANRINMTSTNNTSRKSKRDDPKRSSAPTIVVAASEQQVTKTKSAVKPNEAVVLTQASNTISNKKRRATEIIQNEVPLAERLSAFESQTSAGQINSEQKQQSLSADSLVTLLTQGLQSSDATLLDQVLCCRNEKIIEKTVRALTIPVLLPLIDCLNKYLYQTADKGLIASKWLRAVLSTHTSYLMTCPDITERLGPMYELIEARTRLYPKLARLHGKLSLIASQINSRNNELSNSDATISTKPSFIFEDVSDEDLEGDQTQDELVPSPSEYDEYSGLSDDLDLGIQHNDDDDDDEEEELEAEDMNGSDHDLNFEGNGHMNGDENESDDDEDSS